MTCGSVARSQPPVSSSEDKDAKDCDIVVGGGSWTLIVLERHLGIGIDNFTGHQIQWHCYK